MSTKNNWLKTKRRIWVSRNYHNNAVAVQSQPADAFAKKSTRNKMLPAWISLEEGAPKLGTRFCVNVGRRESLTDPLNPTHLPKTLRQLQPSASKRQEKMMPTLCGRREGPAAPAARDLCLHPGGRTPPPAPPSLFPPHTASAHYFFCEGPKWQVKE